MSWDYSILAPFWGAIIIFNPVLYFFLEKPTIETFTREHGGYAVSIAYNPNNTLPENEYYRIEYIEIGFRAGKEEWTVLDHKEGYNYTRRCQVILPPSLSPVKRSLQVVVKYKSCSTPVYSDVCVVDQPEICKHTRLKSTREI